MFIPASPLPRILRSALILGALLSLTHGVAATAPPARSQTALWLPDGHALVTMPTDQGIVLQQSATLYPKTLDDFPHSIPLFGPEGRVSSRLTDELRAAVSGGKLHLFYVQGNTLSLATTPLPVTPDSSWNITSHPLTGDLRIDLIDAPSSPPGVLVWRHTAGDTGSAIYRAWAGPDGLQIQELISPKDFVARADALADAHGVLHVVWSQAAPEQPIQYQAFSAEGKPMGEPLEILDGGKQPTIALDHDSVLIATEGAETGLTLRWIKDRQVTRTETLNERMRLRPRFTRDYHGVIWLFALDEARRDLYYRRLLGHDFTDEVAAYSVQGQWQHELDFALPHAVARGTSGFTILHRESLPDLSHPRQRFDMLPVPGLSVNDSRHVMFMDLLDVAEIDNAVQRLGSVKKYDGNPLPLNGPAGSPDEAWVNYADVKFYAGKFHMWYTTNTNTFARHWNIGYAESGDGLHWIKPNLGLVTFDGSKENNLLIPDFEDPNRETGPHHAAVSVVAIDETDTDPDRRFKMVFLTSSLGGEPGTYITWSPDGIHWQLPPQRLWGKTAGKNQVIRGFTPWVEPLSSFFRDPLEQHPAYRWKIYGIDGYSGHPYMNITAARTMGMTHGATPYDFKPYPNNPIIDPHTETAEDQNHGGMVEVYEGVYVSIYQHWFGPDWKVDLRLATSRDGLHFTRVQTDQPFLPLGAMGDWDSGMLCTPNQLLRHDNQLWLYYRGSVGTLATGRALSRSDYPGAKQYGEPWRIFTGLARFRPDGFTYLTVNPLQRAGHQYRTAFIRDYTGSLKARVRSISIEADGIASRTLHANIGSLAPHFAWVKARLLDAATGDVIPGFGYEDCDAFTEDSLDHTFTWKGSSSLAGVKAPGIQVEFQLFGTLESPRLHSFWFE
ncbi:MAG: hypothetical protein H7A44_08260 [Opitutaceae bacterium]|nr:hypothetical protein [Cephaloticoccus sp.]MCP5530423.1 hypothetical protein [Opitutaceae bacterium]